MQGGEYARFQFVHSFYERPTWWRYLLSLPLTGLPINLLYSAKSVGEQSISLTSKLGVCNSKRNLSSATQGFVYIFGSLIVTVSSKWSWSTRRNRSSTRRSLLWGRPALSIQVLSSIPEVCTTNV